MSLWEERLQAAAEMTPPDRIEHLWNGLRSMAGRITNTDQSPDVDSMYYKIQKTLLATPGHAQHLANKLEEARAKGTLSRDSYWYFNETLVHLPSPETVKVLGHYLNDERDKPPSPALHKGTMPYPGTFMRAFEALSQIGLRDMPVTDIHVEEEKPAPGEKWTNERWLEAHRKTIIAAYQKQQEALASYRTWWEEVKNGRRTFSFKGQAVEYRFKPDGTWDTIPIVNPPDDDPRKDIRKADQKTQETRGPESPPDETEGIQFWKWVCGAGAVLVPLLTWWLLRHRTSTRME